MDSARTAFCSAGLAVARLAALAAIVAVALLALPASASAASYFVTVDGDDANPCTAAQPCATVQRAIDVHRMSSTPDDVIEVGGGTFVGNFAADEPADEGLTIRGTVNGQTRETTLRGASLGVDDQLIAFLVGGCGAADVRLRNANLDTVDADPELSAVELDGGSSLRNVHATNQPNSEATLVVFACERGSAIVGSEIVATQDDTAIAVLDSLTLADSIVTTETADFPAIIQPGFGFPGVRLRIRRSQVSSPPPSSPAGDPHDFPPVVYAAGRVTLDSSLITGGYQGLQSFDFPNWRINNSTIDAGEPGVSNPATPSLFVDPSFAPADVNVDSSILVDPLRGDDSFGEAGTLTCDFSDFPAVNLTPTWDDQCPVDSGNNTTNPPEDLFVGGSPYDWRLLADGPAIDSGAPGPPPAGFTQRDLAGNPRRAAGSTATCPDGTRDKGAYEFLGPPCELQPPEILGGAGPTPGTQLSSTRGEFNNKPTGYARLWLRCDASGDNCAEIEPPRTRKGYKVRGSDVGRTLKLQVIATNSAGDSDAALSAPTGVVADPPG